MCLSAIDCRIDGMVVLAIDKLLNRIFAGMCQDVNRISANRLSGEKMHVVTPVRG